VTLKEHGWDQFFEDQFTEFYDKGLIPGRIAREERRFYSIMTNSVELNATLRGAIRHKAGEKRELPVVGDWVAVELQEESNAVIHSILERKTLISRKAATGRKRTSGGPAEEQLIAANIDTIFIVTGLDRDFNPHRIERYLTLVYDSGANPVIILNKADLCEDLETCITETEEIAFGVPIHTMCALESKDVDELRSYLAVGKTCALLGSSGSGKSTIINSLLGYDRQKVQEVSEAVGKGQHTTSYRELIVLPSGGIVMDNPGMRELQLWLDDDDLSGSFKDIEELAQRCRFSDCLHESEPNCAVKAAIENGDLDEGRLENYHKMKREIKYVEERKTKSARTVEREKWKEIYRKAQNNQEE